MDNIEIIVYDEIKDYKEKIYFFNIRQWIFAILITVIVVPTYLLLKDKIGEEVTSYIVIIIAGILGFIGFVRIHELPAEKIIPYWFRHYFFFSKPICYMTDKEYEESRQKKRKLNPKLSKEARKTMREKKKQEKKVKKKSKTKPSKKNDNEEIDTKEEQSEGKVNTNVLVDKLSKLSKEQQEALLKLLER